MICFPQCFHKVYSYIKDAGASVMIDEWDKIVFYVCQVLNCSVWPNISNDYDVKNNMLFSQLEAIKKLLEKFEPMKVFKNITYGFLSNQFLCVLYINLYFRLTDTNPLELWSDANNWKNQTPAEMDLTNWIMFMHTFFKGSREIL